MNNEGLITIIAIFAFALIATQVIGCARSDSERKSAELIIQSVKP